VIKRRHDANTCLQALTAAAAAAAAEEADAGRDDAPQSIIIVARASQVALIRTQLDDGRCRTI